MCPALSFIAPKRYSDYTFMNTGEWI
jgi:hypothetical protein